MDSWLFHNCCDRRGGCNDDNPGGDDHTGPGHSQILSCRDSGRCIHRRGGRSKQPVGKGCHWRKNGPVAEGRHGISGKGGVLRSDLPDSIKTIEAGKQVWAVGDFYPEQLPPQVAGTPIANLIKEFQGGTYQMRVDQNVHARAFGNFTSAEHAKSAADLARGALALGKLQASRMPDQAFLQALDGIQIANSGSSVTVNVDESGDVLKKLQTFARRWKERSKRNAG